MLLKAFSIIRFQNRRNANVYDADHWKVGEGKASAAKESDAITSVLSALNGNGRIGRKMSLAARRKISRAQKLRWKNRKK